MSKSISITGYLVKSPVQDQLRLIVLDLSLGFHISDILGIEELDLPKGLSQKLSIPVRIELKKGARLLHYSLGHIYEDLLVQGVRPFALSSRPLELNQVQGSERFDELERQFLTKNGFKIK